MNSSVSVDRLGAQGQGTTRPLMRLDLHSVIAGNFGRDGGEECAIISDTENIVARSPHG